MASRSWFRVLSRLEGIQADNTELIQIHGLTLLVQGALQAGGNTDRQYRVNTDPWPHALGSGCSLGWREYRQTIQS